MIDRARAPPATAATRERRAPKRATCSAPTCTTRSTDEGLPEAAVLASLGLREPHRRRRPHPGETVLDLGSGGGIDVLLSAKRVGPTGKVYGLDMTEEMLALAIRNRDEAGCDQRRVPEGLHRGGPAAREHGRRRHLQLRRSTCRRTSRASSPRCTAFCGPAGGSGSPTSSPTTTLTPTQRAERGTLRRLHRRRAVVRGVRGRSSRAAGFGDISITSTHESTPGMHSAIVKATKRIRPEAAGPTPQHLNSR